MAITLSDNMRIQAPKPGDDRYGPWGSLALAQAGIATPYRHLGLTVGVLDAQGNVREYWWKAGLSDEHLLRKFTTADLTVGEEYGDANLYQGGHHQYLSVDGIDTVIGTQTVMVDVGRNRIPASSRKLNMRVSVHQLDGTPPVDYLLVGRREQVPYQNAQLVQAVVYEQFVEHNTYLDGVLQNSSYETGYFMLRAGEALGKGSRYCEVVDDAGVFKALTPSRLIGYEQLEQDVPATLPASFTGQRLVRTLRLHTVYQNRPQPVSLAAVPSYETRFLGTPTDNEQVWVRAGDIRPFSYTEAYDRLPGIMVYVDQDDTRLLFQSLVAVQKTGTPARNPSPVDVEGNPINPGVWIPVGGGKQPEPAPTIVLRDILSVPFSIRQLVVAGAYDYGELLGEQPPGSKTYMEFTTRYYTYRYTRGFLGLLVWVRYAKGL